jgi:hypothetical protein
VTVTESREAILPDSARCLRTSETRWRNTPICFASSVSGSSRHSGSANALSIARFLSPAVRGSPALSCSWFAPSAYQSASRAVPVGA